MPVQASIDLTVVLQLLQYVLSLVGLVALARLVVEFVSAYAAKQKELSVVDKDIRDALTEAWKNEKELRKQDTEIFAKKFAYLQQTAKSLEMRLTKTNYEIALLKVRNEVVDLVAKTASQLGEEYCKEFFIGAFATFKDTVLLLATESKMDIKSFDESISRGIAGGPLPEKANARLVYYAMRQMVRLHGLANCLIISSAFVQSALEDYDASKDPDRLLSDMFYATYKRLSLTRSVADIEAKFSTPNVIGPGDAGGND